MARMRRVDVPDDYKPDARPAAAPAVADTVISRWPVTDKPGYEAQVIELPARYWVTFDRQAVRGNLTVSKWLEKLLAHMARE